MTIRPAVAEDAEGIARVFLESAEQHARLDPERYAVPAFEAVAARYRGGGQHPRPDAAAITLVAEQDGAIAGFVDARLERPADAMHRDTVYCYVAEIAVRAELRSQGIGERLVRAAEEWAVRHGAEFVYLEYHAENPRAGAFYRERLGYRAASITAVKRLR